MDQFGSIFPLYTYASHRPYIWKGIFLNLLPKKNPFRTSQKMAEGTPIKMARYIKDQTVCQYLPTFGVYSYGIPCSLAELTQFTNLKMLLDFSWGDD